MAQRQQKNALNKTTGTGIRMNTPNAQTALKKLYEWIEANPAKNHFMLLDGAQDNHIYSFAQNALDSMCFYKGITHEELIKAAPYLVRITPESSVFERFFKKFWGQSWGMVIASDSSMETVYLHLKKFQKLRRSTGMNILFRYYDPRVLRHFMNAATDDEIEKFSGEIKGFFMENVDGTPLSF